MSTKYLLNSETLLNFDLLLKEISSACGHVKTHQTPYGKNINVDQYQQTEIKKMYDSWKDAGYIEQNVIEWTNYYPDQHFTRNLLTPLIDRLSVSAKNIWISGISPGKCVPWHWDIESNSQSWSREGKIKRFTVFIDPPKLGHIFVVGNQCFYLVEQGSVFEWNEWNDYHLGVNCGFDPKYILHIIGVSR